MEKQTWIGKITLDDEQRVERQSYMFAQWATFGLFNTGLLDIGIAMFSSEFNMSRKYLKYNSGN
jgi:hypothetical protein